MAGFIIIIPFTYRVKRSGGAWRARDLFADDADARRVANMLLATVLAHELGHHLANVYGCHASGSANELLADQLSVPLIRELATGELGALHARMRAVADAMNDAGLFTPLALNMVRLGEETGRLDEMLLEVARVHDGEVQSGVKRALQMVEPVLILLMGGIIAVIIVSILMGILSVNDLAG